MEPKNSDTHLTFKQLRTQYTEDQLSGHSKIDDLDYRQLRYKLFAPFFLDLFENKVVYFERPILAIVRLEDLRVNSAGIGATAIPLLNVMPFEEASKCDMPLEWKFSGTWEFMVLARNSLYMQIANWRVWPEYDRVKSVEQAILRGKYKYALSLTKEEPSEPGE
jgi:hypothetical protein